MRLIVVGESTAAGCGAGTHDEAFSGTFARALSELHTRPVTWQVHARHGATIRRVRHRIIAELDTQADVAVLLIGVNDVLARTPVRQWREDLAAVLVALAAVAEHVVVAGVPPFDSFPSLPRALGTYLAKRGRTLDDAAQEACAAHPSISWMSSTGLKGAEAEFFARDGFHPSPAGYQWWAKDVAHRLSQEPAKR